MKDILDLLTDDRIVNYGLVAISCILLFNLFIWGCLSFIIVIIAIACGYYMFDYALKNQNLNTTSRSENIFDKTKIYKCNDCKNCISSEVHLKCLNQETPWKGLLIPEQIDSSIDKLLSKIIKVYIENWYDNISNDPHFIKEIKQVIRFATSVLLKRFLQLDLEDIVLYKVIPICLSHIRHCQRMEKGEKIAYHYAISNRKVEIMYLKKVSSSLLPFIIRQTDLQCTIFYTLVRELLSLWVLLPISDVICNPINIAFTWSKLSKSSIISTNATCKDKKVEFLSKFIAENQNYPVQLEMRSIFKDSTILSAFTAFLKRKGAVHLLQFCLDVDQFNKRMLKPEISSQELDMLYRDAWDIFSVYFSSHSPDCINFDPELVSQLRKVLSKDVIKLQNSKPLYQAYEQTYSILQNSYWIEFHNSDEYFSWICGPRNIPEAGSSQESSNNEKKNCASKLSRKLNRIKGAMKSSTIYDGQFDSLSSECDPEYGEDLSVDSEIINGERDLSTWKVTDVTSAMKLESGSNGGQSLVFFITVETVKNDLIKQWCVERRLADFYTLKSKLTEFHGVFVDARLPSRRILLQKTENNDIYMQFLNQLLQKPELRGSDLLHMFLTSIDNFEDSESAIGRLLRKSMPMALRKERGQNLESFISIFMASIETKLKQRYEWKDLSEHPPERKFKIAENPIFGNNLNIIKDENQTTLEEISEQIKFPYTPINCIIFFGVHVYNMSNAVVRLILAVQSICGNIVDSIIQRYISLRIVRSITPSKISNLIELLENLLFPGDDAPQKTDHQISVEHLKLLNNSVFFPLYMCLYQCTQNSVMNKQLFYRLLDVLLAEMFPELRTQLNEQL
ncbi:sorting nexin-14 [Acyrthosiphon pisum]|uniref:Sorting nexin-14 n=1 Tax=Acyrthosiphon pisum TaxID=7029 RepID=A0A8R2A3Z0_ACYPI|nr:sorting nexin-14 [Acyrthosiphon pisum]|eukprot:XP_003240642.1 PREDICTED: sorting nexin-14 [Acyrthosiphon pisum]